MGLYSRYILPKMINSACAMPQMMALRKRYVPLAKGRVLEIGIGSGLNPPGTVGSPLRDREDNVAFPQVLVVRTQGSGEIDFGEVKTEDRERSDFVPVHRGKRRLLVECGGGVCATSA